MKISTIKQDLFTISDPEYVFAHCIASDYGLGAGIAKTFRDKYPELISYLKTQPNKYPNIISFTGNDGRVIYNLVDKPFSSKPPKRADFLRTLLHLRNHMVNNDQHKLAIPKIGAGLDKLDWSITEQNLKNVFRDTDIEITVCVL